MEMRYHWKFKAKRAKLAIKEKQFMKQLAWLESKQKENPLIYSFPAC